MNDLHYMRIALKQAKKAELIGEVPVGAVVVKTLDDGSHKIISYGYNKRESKKNALMHAEISAIDKACKALKSWRLSGCTLFVTLEPCPMCAGAAINARLDRVVFGARDLRFGALGSATNLFEVPFNHIPELTGPIMQEECSSVLTEFFRKKRKNKSV